MKKYFLPGWLSVFLTATCFGEPALPTLIPAAVKMVPQPGRFELQPGTDILVDSASEATGKYLAAQLSKSTGYELKVRSVNSHSSTGAIVLTTAPARTDLGPEGYELVVATNGILIRAAESAGLFYGVQSLLELLPPEILSPKPVAGISWTVPCVQIEDRPRFAWRGVMLDVSRHFLSKPEIESFLDTMALHKLNLFHWHLTDDHGWRIEIRKYPRLTETGAWRQDIGFGLDRKWSAAYGPDGRYGGFYTQDDIREIVAYAAARDITILPEIEMPGHSSAALAAYPELTCAGVPPPVPSQAGIFNGIYCAGNEESFEFLQNVLTEMFQLFPCKYIHVGGDEVPTNTWASCPKDQAVIKREGLKDASQLENYFIRRIEKFITANGRTLIGWSEIAHGELGTNAVVMDWIGGGLEAARAGHDVVMASEKSLYLCYYPSLDRTPKMRAYRPVLPINQVYDFEPVPATLELPLQSHILGAEACIWTPDIPAMREVEEMALPRLSAFAEVVWSPKAARNWEDFSRRLPLECRRLDASGVNYWHDDAVEIGRWRSGELKASENLLSWDASAAIKSSGRYRLSMDYFKGKPGAKINWAALLADGREIARDAHPGFTGTASRHDTMASDWNYYLSVPDYKPGVRYTVQASLAGSVDNATSGVVFLAPDSSKHRSSGGETAAVNR